MSGSNQKFQGLERSRVATSKAWKFLLIPALALLSGCATVPYRYGANFDDAHVVKLREGEPQIERGKPNALIDGVGWVLGIPSKILLLNIRMDNHFIGTNTELALSRYLATNNLPHVKVRLNQYAPGAEWSRLFRNKSVGWGWRYTFGVVTELFYTILPGRLFGGDHYNPFTNTINIYSDVPAVTLHEGGHAKDFAGRTWKGTYAFAYALPLVALYPEALASSDAISYLRAEAEAMDEEAAYKILYPAYATYIGGSFSQYVAPYAWVYYAAVVPGHIAGQWKATTVEKRRAQESAEEF